MIVARGLGSPGRLLASSGLGRFSKRLVAGGAARFCLYIIQTVVRSVER
jgi:hypothetical protein